MLNKLILFIAGFLLHDTASAQVFVSANTNIYVNNEVVYIKQGLELNAASSNFYLRNQSQFLQGTTGLGTNKGIGALSIYQEGSGNEFQFNYWCSPVGNRTTASSVNNPFGITQLGIPVTTVETTPAIILMMNNYTGTASPFAIAPFWISKLIQKSNYSDWIQVGSDSSIEVGEGFTMKGSSGINTTLVDGIQNNPDGLHQRYDFKGKPNDGIIDIKVIPTEMTLTGNPYPSAIDLQAFLKDPANSSCTGIAYFWEQDTKVYSHNIAEIKGGYGTYSPAGGSNDNGTYIPAVFFSYDGLGNQTSEKGSSGHYFERKYAPIGQGFMIEGLANGTVQMKNSYRVFVKEGVMNFSNFQKKSNNKTIARSENLPQIRFNTLLDNGSISQMVLGFNPLSTDGIDRAMDAASPNDGPANNYFVINENEYLINIMPFDIDTKIAIGFRNVAAANYKITVNEMLNLPEVANVFLHDITANLYYDIKNSLFNITLPAGTNNNTQYEITFKNGTLGVPNVIKQSSFVVQQDNTLKKLIISNQLLKEITSCNLYDVVGKLIFTKNQLGTNSSYTFSTSDLRDGIYIVKLTTRDNSEMGSKIIVKN